ncbi:MAG: UpxY family transcription antiterminator [Candidatus Acidiferrum sp.]
MIENSANSVYSPGILPARATSEAERQEDHLRPCWYAVYTLSRHEKRVAEQLQNRRVSHFLPLLQRVHRWKDRRMKVQLPYFPNYLFVQIAYGDRLPVLQTPGVVRIVGTLAHPTTVPNEQIATLRTALELGLHIEPRPMIEVGRKVRLRSGPFEGTEGILLRKKGKVRFVVSIRAIMRSFAVEVDAMDVRPA